MFTFSLHQLRPSPSCNFPSRFFLPSHISIFASFCHFLLSSCLSRISAFIHFTVFPAGASSAHNLFFTSSLQADRTIVHESGVAIVAEAQWSWRGLIEKGEKSVSCITHVCSKVASVQRMTGRWNCVQTRASRSAAESYTGIRGFIPRRETSSE